MSPGVLAAGTSFTIAPVKKTAEEKHNFGAIIENVNLDDISGKPPMHANRWHLA
ncbi:hypothetical protein LY78DRAFT_658298, partial [Colletotrichum sublineola]